MGAAMGLSSAVFICFLLLGGSELCYSQTAWSGETNSPLPSRHPVVVECLEAQLVVTVSRNLFGTGKLVRPADLTLGPESCEPLSSADTEDAVRFEVGLHECGNEVQVRMGPRGGGGECGHRARERWGWAGALLLAGGGEPLRLEVWDRWLGGWLKALPSSDWNQVSGVEARDGRALGARQGVPHPDS